MALYAVCGTLAISVLMLRRKINVTQIISLQYIYHISYFGASIYKYMYLFRMLFVVLSECEVCSVSNYISELRNRSASCKVMQGEDP